MPISGHFIYTLIPSDWKQKPVFNRVIGKEKLHLMGFLPEGQTAGSWTKMITVLGQKRGKFTKEKYFKLMVQKKYKSCSKDNISAEIIRKANQFLTGVISCGKVINKSKNGGLSENGQGEITAYRIFEKGDHLFPIVHTWRGKEFNIKDANEKKFPATKMAIAKYFAGTSKSEVCDNENTSERCKGYIKNYLVELQEPLVRNEQGKLESSKNQNVKQAFKIPFSSGIEEEKANPNWANILFPTNKKYILTQIPENWDIEPAYEKIKDPIHTVSFHPKGQDKNNWKERIKFNGYQGIAATPDSLFKTTYEWLRAICEKGNIAAMPVRKTKDRMVSITMCGKVVKKINGLKENSGLLSVETIISNDGTFYTLNYSWVGKVFDVKEKTDQGLPAPAKKISSYIKALNSTFICDPYDRESSCHNYAIVSKRGNKITNTQAWGSLRSYNPLVCKNLESVTNKYTPADIYKGVTNCIEQKEYKRGAYLHALASAYLYFDKLRVTDRTAHNARTMLLTESLSSVGNSIKSFQKSIKNVFGNPVELSRVCGKIKAIGAPDYYPTYMIQHGLQTLNKGGIENRLVENFEPKVAWKASLQEFLKCSGN